MCASHEELFSLLKRLCEAWGPPGREDSVREIVIDELRNYVDEIHVDSLGNVIAVKRGSRGGAKLVLAAHMDEVGFVVSHIDDKGFLRVLPVGGLHERNVISQRIAIRTRDGRIVRGVVGAKPPHVAKPEEARQVPEFRELFVDIGASSREEVEKLGVRVGDFAVFDRDLQLLGTKRVTGKALDDRVGLAVMISVVKELEKHEVDLYAVATVQEEVGLKGARVAAYAIDPDAAIALDVTIALDVPGVGEHEYVTRLGRGPAIKVIDGRMGTGLIANPKLFNKLIEIAEKHGIPYQVEVAPGGTTDASAINLTKRGVPAVTVSIPTRYLHSSVEVLDLDDVVNAVKLVKRFIEEVPSEWLASLRGYRAK